MLQTLRDLVRMSVASGSRVDYVQAGGGNTSCKFPDGSMAIKASGYLLKDMTENVGFVVVDAVKMRRYHEEDHPDTPDCNKESMQLAINSIHAINGEKAARPSVEVGFHSVLDQFVLHLHPVYVNVLMCAKDGLKKALGLMADTGLPCIGIPYTMPGYGLTKLIMEASADYEAAHGVRPQVIFLENHGVVTTAETADGAMALMDQVNDTLKAKLGLPDFPAPAIRKVAEHRYASACDYLNQTMQGPVGKACRYAPIYPDQLVYTSNELSIDGSGKGKIALVDGVLYYTAGEKEAHALEETMLAVAYVYDCIARLGLAYQELTEEQCSQILGWDSEKYRKSLMTE